MTALELAYRHPKRGKAHRHDTARYWPKAWIAACGVNIANGRHVPAVPNTVRLPIEGWLAVPVDSLDPADLCKRCWPERAK